MLCLTTKTNNLSYIFKQAITTHTKLSYIFKQAITTHTNDCCCSTSLYIKLPVYLTKYGTVYFYHFTKQHNITKCVFCLSHRSVKCYTYCNLKHILCDEIQSDRVMHDTHVLLRPHQSMYQLIICVAV